jgi:invasion protein IalB
MEHPMTRQTTALALALLLGMMPATISLAQDSAAPAPATSEAAPAAEAPAQTTGDLPLGTAAEPAPDGPGTSYVAATFDAWEQRCLRTTDGSDPCELFQPLNDNAGNSVAQISIVSLPPGRPAAAGASVMVPLRTLLLEPLLMAIDGAPPKQYEYTVCAQVGCVAQFGLTAEELAAMKAGAKARLTITPFDAPDQKVILDISLKGFTAAFNAVSAP